MFYKYECESGYKCCIFGTESPCKWNAAKDKNNSQQCSKNKYKSPIGIIAEKERFSDPMLERLHSKKPSQFFKVITSSIHKKKWWHSTINFVDEYNSEN